MAFQGLKGTIQPDSLPFADINLDDIITLKLEQPNPVSQDATPRMRAPVQCADRMTHKLLYVEPQS